MAWLEQNGSKSFHICFRFGGHKYRRSLRTDDESKAQGQLVRLEENIQLVETGRLTLPPDADPATFLLSDGKLNGKVKTASAITLGKLFTEFFDSLPDGSLEDSTIGAMQIHRRHLERHMGKGFKVKLLCVDKLQGYVVKRSKEPGLRGHTVGANTVKKELVTFRSVWDWAVDRKYVAGPFPNKGVRLPKETEKPPFQTWAEIERQIERGNLTDDQQAELWDCLFLSLKEIDQLLEYVKENATQPFVYPMFVIAAHTGARRSELMRCEIRDFDENAVLLRERKRVRGKHSFRRVPLSKKLREVMNEWLKNHPGGPLTFCLTSDGENSPLTRNNASNYFSRTLSGGKWARISGWHCLRHSFISNCAKEGVDQRIIDAWVGHQTDEMRRRYRHLFPDTEQAAMSSVFS